MTLNSWRYMKPSQILYCDGFLVIRDENFSSWFSRILVVQVIDHIWTVLLLYKSKFCYLYRMWERGSIVFTYICLSSSCQLTSDLYWMPYRVTCCKIWIYAGSLLPCLLILTEWFLCLIWFLWKSFLWTWI
jgi:hypothetical protein